MEDKGRRVGGEAGVYIEAKVAVDVVGKRHRNGSFRLTISSKHRAFFCSGEKGSGSNLRCSPEYGYMF